MSNPPKTDFSVLASFTLIRFQVFPRPIVKNVESIWGFTTSSILLVATSCRARPSCYVATLIHVMSHVILRLLRWFRFSYNDETVPLVVQFLQLTSTNMQNRQNIHDLEFYSTFEMMTTFCIVSTILLEHFCFCSASSEFTIRRN